MVSSALLNLLMIISASGYVLETMIYEYVSINILLYPVLPEKLQY